MDEDVKFEFVKKNLKYLDTHRGAWGGDQYLFRFPNSYGASIIRHRFSYGGLKGLWELMIIKWVDEDKWEMVEGIGVEKKNEKWKVKRMEEKRLGDAVTGFLPDSEVTQILKSIKTNLKGISEVEDGG